MGILDKTFKNLFNKDVSGLMVKTSNEEPRLPVYSQWFYTAPLGQPRNINIKDLRDFGNSAWVQMVKNTIKKEVSIIPYDIVPVDDEDETDYTKEKKLILDKLERINTDGESLLDITTPWIEDMCDIDAGVWIKAYTLDSYTIGDVPTYNNLGQVVKTTQGLVLKPLGQRKLEEVRIADASTILKQVDPYKRLLCYYQYSYKNPRSNPRMFFNDEVIYSMMNPQSDSVYGFSPVQSIQQVLELLINSTRWNKDYFKNNAIPDGIIGLPNASKESMDSFKSMWENTIKGKPHKLIYHNTAATFQQFMSSARDMEWLEGTKFYFHLVFGVFGMSPTEAGFHENVNQGNQAGQERVTVKNAIKPYLCAIERAINRNIITEILQEPIPKLKFVYLPKDHAEEQIEFEQAMKEIEVGALTVNEYRHMKGLKPVDWGDEPSKPQMNSTDAGFQAEAQAQKEEQKPTKPEKSFMIPYKKAFEGYMKVK